MRQVQIIISKSEQLRRFEQATWKEGRMLEQPQSVKQVYNLQADQEESADSGLMQASFETHLWEGINIIKEYLADTPDYQAKPNDDNFVINLQLPQNWVIHSAPGLKFAMLELVHNGMMADWQDMMKPDQANSYKKKAELNKAQIQSIIYALNAP